MFQYCIALCNNVLYSAQYYKRLNTGWPIVLRTKDVKNIIIGGSRVEHNTPRNGAIAPAQEPPHFNNF